MSRGRASAAGAARSANAATRWATGRPPLPRTGPPTGPHAAPRIARPPSARGRPTPQAEQQSPAPAAEDSTRCSSHSRGPMPVPPLPHRAARSARCPRLASPSLASAHSMRCGHGARDESIPRRSMGRRWLSNDPASSRSSTAMSRWAVICCRTGAARGAEARLSCRVAAGGRAPPGRPPRRAHRCGPCRGRPRP